MSDDDGAVPVAPRYLEAYPRLRIAPAVRGARTGYTLILWRSETGDPIGSTSLQLSATDTLVVDTVLFHTPTIAENQSSFAVPLVKREAGRFRQEDYAVCACGRAVKVLIYRHHDWKCSACHKLVNRSALVGRPIRLVEQLAKVTQKLGAGRRPGMHNSTYQALLDKCAWLEAELGGFRGYANTDYTIIVNAEFARPFTGWSR